MKKAPRLILIAITVSCFDGGAVAHDVGAHPVTTTGLPELGDAWKEVNPYRGNGLAVTIGSSGYAQNCARCHGIEGLSGGFAPDLRRLEPSPELDMYFEETVRQGRTRDGKVYMPPFEGILSQEAIWAIRTYLESRFISD